MHLLGFRFAPRIATLGSETKLYVPQGVQTPDVAPADRRHPEHQARACPLGRHPALDQAGHRHRLADAAQLGSYRARTDWP